MTDLLVASRVLYRNFDSFKELKEFAERENGKMVIIKTIDGDLPQILGETNDRFYPYDYGYFDGTENYTKDNAKDFIHDEIKPYICEMSGEDAMYAFLNKYNEVLNEIINLKEDGAVCVGDYIEVFPKFAIEFRHDNFKMEIGVLVTKDFAKVCRCF